MGRAARGCTAYSAPIDNPQPHAQDTTMKTSLTTRFASFCFAVVLTAGTLASINGLAVSDAPDTQVARVQATQKA